MLLLLKMPDKPLQNPIWVFGHAWAITGRPRHRLDIFLYGTINSTPYYVVVCPSADCGPVTGHEGLLPVGPSWASTKKH